MYRLLALDLDGTLLTPQKQITPRTFELLCQVSQAGMKLIIATGQTAQVLRAVAAGLPLAAPQIIENGALVIDLVRDVILHEQLIPAELILPALARLRASGFHRAYHTHERVYVDKGTPRASSWYRPPVPPAIEVEDVASLYPRRCIKIAGIGAAEMLRARRREFEDLFAGRLYVTQSSFDLLEFLHPAVSKGHALRIIAADLGIRPDEVVAVGDNHNDLGMLRFAGLGVAMGNAHQEVKTEADYVTGSNSEEGVAALIEDVILPALK
jgi:Cof subfamily protein (haloacid dehalogenase superfamily)